MEEFGSFDTLESGWWAEVSAEVQEKQREQAKKAIQGIKKTQKDERKAQKSDDWLVQILVHFLKNPKYDSITIALIPILDAGFPSPVLLGLVSLLEFDISAAIRKHYNKPLPAKFSYIPTEDLLEFSESTIDTRIQTRINTWFDDMLTVTTQDSSVILTDIFLDLIKKSSNKKEFLDLMTYIFRFFMGNIRIRVPEKSAHKYSEFFLWELIKKIQASSEGQEKW